MCVCVYITPKQPDHLGENHRDKIFFLKIFERANCQLFPIQMIHY